MNWEGKTINGRIAGVTSTLLLFFFFFFFLVVVGGAAAAAAGRGLETNEAE